MARSAGVSRPSLTLMTHSSTACSTAGGSGEPPSSVHRDAAALQDAAALTLRAATPHPVVDAVGEGVLETGLPHRAVGADPPCDLDAHAITRKEGRWGDFPAQAPCHPLGLHQIPPFQT